MRLILAVTVLAITLVAPVCSKEGGSPFVGRWDFNVQTNNGPRANWLGISEKTGKLEVWFQPTGGNVFQVKDFDEKGSDLVLRIAPSSATRPAMVWELKAKGDTLTGVQKTGMRTMPLTGYRAPALARTTVKSWSKPETLFNGKDLDGWKPIGNPADSHWVVKQGLLVNEAHGANLRSVREFEDVKVHFEVNCPENANSGFYLRGRYEMQLEYEAAGTEPPERGMGSIYGRLAPSKELPRTPGKWETFDITLVGRTVSIVRNGIKIIDQKEIEGITGGALDANEGKPGPFYIQGDHTGGLQFRNITVAVPQQ